MQVARRVRRACQNSIPEFTEQILPWGLPLRFQPRETIGASIWRMGLYDLCVSEAIWRLLEPGEVALDVGANIGHMTSIMALRVGAAGSVLAFEPHPDVYRELTDNIALWRERSDLGRIVAHRAALSDGTGEAVLHVPGDFESNHGTASLVPPDRGSGVDSRSCRVERLKLDIVLENVSSVGLMKLDVEGHEIEVLRGGVASMKRKKIRDIVFEEHRDYPTPVTEWLEEYGYSIFRLAKHLFRLEVSPITKSARPTKYDAPNYVATQLPERALRRLSGGGWQALICKSRRSDW